MRDVLAETIERLAAGEQVALCVVVATRGSTPQARGAKMLVTAAGQTVGTLGGGCVEAEVRREAIGLLSAGQSKLLTFRLDHDYGWDDGLICGGVMDILVHVMNTPADGRAVVGTAGRIEIPYADPNGRQAYVEEIGRPPVLVIAGAGHVGQALGRLAADLGFDLVVIDDRADYASAERFPSARATIVGDIEHELAKFPVDAATYFVIVTRGHRHDGRALAAVIDSPAAYVGLIGSRSKIKRIFKDLHAGGTAVDKLLRVRAPIGLDIGAVTVPEIAVSIAAELVAVRRGVEVGSAAMKMNESELRRWLENGPS
jgi:xanthine dehydrogenase accessory factor